MHHKKEKPMTFKDVTADLNNNAQAEKYSLRQRHRRQSGRNKDLNDDAAVPVLPASFRKPKPSKSKPKAAPLSKYRRKTANARERTRMREINSAFENLRKCVPFSIANDPTPATVTNEKLTKITTLRLAMKYIRTLNDVLSQPHHTNNNTNDATSNRNLITTQLHSHQDSDSSLYFDDSKDIFSELLVAASNLGGHCSLDHVKKRTKDNRIKCYSKGNKNPCLSVLDGSPVAFGLMLDSDGESLNLSEPCLSPMSQSYTSFSCSANSMELGILLDSDNDSLQLSEHCLSPFGDLLSTGFAEPSSLDMYLT